MVLPKELNEFDLTSCPRLSLKLYPYFLGKLGISLFGSVSRRILSFDETFASSGLDWPSWSTD